MFHPSGKSISIGFLTFCVALSSGLAIAHADTLRMGGTGAATELMKVLGAAFEAGADDVTVEVIAGLGSSGSIAAATDSALDIAVSARPLKPAEVETGLTQSVFAQTPYGLVSSNPNPGDIAASELAAFYASTTSTWPDGTPVRVILRPNRESDTALLGGMFAGMAEAIDTVRLRIDVPVAATDQDNLELASSLDGSLVGTSLAQVVTEHRQLHFMTIDGYQPTLENLENGSYPFAKSFYLVVSGTPTPLAQRFTAFLQSVDGKRILSAAACRPVVN